MVILYYIVIKNTFEVTGNIIPHWLLWKNTNTSQDKLFTIKEDFIDTNTAINLAELLTNHKENIKNGGLGDVFHGVRGFTVRFKNKEHARELFHERLELPEVWEIFEKIHSRDTNAWIINTLIVEPSQRTNKKRNKVDLHYDDTIGIESPLAGFIPFWKRDLSAHWINMVYIQIPPKMIGGELVCWPQGFSRLHELARFIGASSLLSKNQPSLAIQPRSGMHIKVRGDGYHAVEPFYAGDPELADMPRISLIIEEYKCNSRELQEIGDNPTISRAY